MDIKTRSIIHEKLLELAHIKDVLPDFPKKDVMNKEKAGKSLYVTMADIEKVLCELQEQEENGA